MPDEELNDRNDKAKTTYEPCESGAAKDIAITWDEFFMRLAHKSKERPGIDPKPDHIVKINTILIHTSYNFIIARSMYSVTT